MKTKKSELLTALGVGILIEGLICFAMLYIGTTSEAVSSFAAMLVITIFLGCLAYIASLGRQNRHRKNKRAIIR